MAERSAAADRPLAGRHAVVTGGGSGIGAAAALELARLGAKLTLMGRRPDRLRAEAARIGAEMAVEVAAQPLDVTDPEAVRAAFAAVAERLGTVGILVNNAGAAASAPFARTSLDLLDAMLAVNLRGAFLCTQAVLPAMLRAGSGRIVNVASTAGLAGYAYVTAYCAAKHGLIGLTRSLALETAKSGVTVNAVCPGYTDTELVSRAVDTIVAKTGRAAEAVRAELARTNPMGRLVTPTEVAAAIAFLCLPGSGAVTGQAVVVAGGEVTP
jgi:NAD(P)-dependent dehydrogenase (short-subunit alcohol dehydrogenase family)